MGGSEATLGKTLGYGDRQPLGHSVFQQLSATIIYQHLHYHDPTVTTLSYSLYITDHTPYVITTLLCQYNSMVQSI